MNHRALWRVLVYVGKESWHVLIRTKPRRWHRNILRVREKRELSRAGGRCLVWSTLTLVKGKSCESEDETAGVLLNIQLLFSSPNKILSHSRSHNFFCPQEKHSICLKSSQWLNKKKKFVMSKKYYLGIVYYYN